MTCPNYLSLYKATMYIFPLQLSPHESEKISPETEKQLHSFNDKSGR